MKQGIKKFTSLTQGARTGEGKKIGEDFVKEVLNILLIEDIKSSLNRNMFKAKTVSKKTPPSMTPDFVIRNTSKEGADSKKYLILESKYKQISGSDWEKIESNFGYHEYFYNELCNLDSKTIVILSGYWRELQKRHYESLISYFKKTYGENCIFDFGDSVDEIYRFAKFLGYDLSGDVKIKIEKCYKKFQEKPKS